ncbi:MazG nucleotide pyrophosphohydrolase domain-containing protein [Saccharopolyspora pogona]|uniref:MazG nucleotide pyrophosphohydrolase domain-containing protein n=1 Tax=Saccharopolyspora pogona TaxID=333966 RepID=UPI001682070A|nr:MazG nucleotide pyrophosphohydrolase domain-containing protein [Saccharopolyspora pogona]
MLPLRTGVTLSELQRYVAEMEAERGFTQSTVSEQARLGEEVAELFKAIRKQADLPVDHRSITGTVAEELVDIAIYVRAIANRQGVDLEEAFGEKESLNEERTWWPAGERPES